MRDIRGDQVSMIFQEPMTSLNPVFTCGDQIAEAVQQHTAVSRARRLTGRSRCSASSASPTPSVARTSTRISSGGMRQRVMIAMALSTDPDLLIADEPTTALDVTIQAQILEVMRDLRQKNRMAIMLITHDLGVVAEMADEVVVMYSGKVVERGDVRTIFGNPHHPYTKGLLSSIPRLDERVERLEVIKGTVPSPYNLPTGCLFKRRCPYRMPVCEVAPPYQEVGEEHHSRCWLTPGGEAGRRRRCERRGSRACGRAPHGGTTMTEQTTVAPGDEATGMQTSGGQTSAQRTAARRRSRRRTLLEVDDLVKHFDIRGGLLGVSKLGAVRAVDG